MRSEKDVHDQAAHWLVCRDRLEDCSDTRQQFETWLAADARHRTAYLALERAWRAADGLKAWRPRDGSVDLSVLRKGTPARGRAIHRFAVAAIVLLVIGCGARLGWLAWSFDTYATDVGGFRRVLLDDGSVLQLNTDTKVRVRLADARREVRLLRGEAHFTVAHDARRPFDVLASGTVIRAVGTAFTVRIREPDDIEVLVTEGKVTLGPLRAPEAQQAANAVSAPVAAMNRVHAKPDGVRIESLAQTELTRLLAWQAGELVFDDLSLGEAVAEFNRYNNRQLEIVDAELATVRIGGNFRSTDPDGFARALQASFPIEVRQSSSIIVLSKRRTQ